jgi:hypothetical protein
MTVNIDRVKSWFWKSLLVIADASTPAWVLSVCVTAPLPFAKRRGSNRCARRTMTPAAQERQHRCCGELQPVGNGPQSGT